MDVKVKKEKSGYISTPENSEEVRDFRKVCTKNM